MDEVEFGESQRVEFRLGKQVGVYVRTDQVHILSKPSARVRSGE